MKPIPIPNPIISSSTSKCSGTAGEFTHFLKSLILCGLWIVLGVPAKGVADTEADIQNLINKMTLDEVQAMCYGNGMLDGGSCPRLGIGPIRMSDGPLGAHRTAPATAFGSGLLIAQTWNPTLQYQVGEVLGKETNGNADMLLGPGMNILRDLVAGRSFEYNSVDPYLNGKTAVKIIQGIRVGFAPCYSRTRWLTNWLPHPALNVP